MTLTAEEGVTDCKERWYCLQSNVILTAEECDTDCRGRLYWLQKKLILTAEEEGYHSDVWGVEICLTSQPRPMELIKYR
jgi:hypothetical protein